jgi:MAF protein
LTPENVFVLASASPRRKQLISLVGWKFRIVPAEINEAPLAGESPQDYVLRIAGEKSKTVASKEGNGSLVIAADTTVADQDKILGKPLHQEEAMRMLQDLRGRTHQVYTSVAVLRAGDDLPATDLATTDVPMREYKVEEIQAYIATGDPFDKAGGYAIQHTGFNPVEKLSGCYANVVGLPLCHLVRIMERFDCYPLNDVPRACQKMLDYRCFVYERILRGEP